MSEMLAKVIDEQFNHVNSGMARLMKLLNVGIETHADGAYVYDHTGAQYLDCGGYCVFLLGRSHPEIVERAKQQLSTVSLGSRLLINKDIGEAASKLIEIAPAGLEYVWFANSGAESVEAAIKLCKLNGRTRFIAMEGGFHGKTIGALSVTHNPKYRTPFLPLMPGVEFIKFGDIEALKSALSQFGGESAVIMEPIQSEAGVIIPHQGYLREVEAVCRQAGAFLVMDEISTGLGRTGHWWYCQSEGVTPDILLCGKALGGGLVPVSALMCTSSIYEVFNANPLLHTSTFAGSPLVNSVVSETIRCLQDSDAPAKAASIGDSITDGIRELISNNEFSFINGVRNRGLLIAIEFSEEKFSGEFLLEMITRKVIVSHSLNAHATVRLTPSILLNSNDISFLLSAVENALITIKNRYLV